MYESEDECDHNGQEVATNDEEEFPNIQKSLDDPISLCDKMLNLYNNRELSDVVLRVGEFEFPAHRLILINSSEYFQQIFTQNCKEKVQKVVTLEVEEESHEFFEGFLKFFYTNKLEISVCSVFQYFMLADRYVVTSLKNICLEFMIEHFNVNPDLKRVMAWMNCTNSAGDLESKLKEKLMQFIAWNLKLFATTTHWCQFDIKLLKELLKRDDLVVPNEFTLYQWVIRWLKLTESDEKILVRKLQELLPLIRFKMMPLGHLDEVLHSYFVNKHSDHYLLKHIVPAFRYHTTTALPASSNECISTSLRLYNSNQRSSKTKAQHKFCLSFANPAHPISNVPLSATPSNANLGEKTYWTIRASTHQSDDVFENYSSTSQKDIHININVQHALAFSGERREIGVNLLVCCKQAGVSYVKQVCSHEMVTIMGQASLQMWLPVSSGSLYARDSGYSWDEMHSFMFVMIPKGRALRDVNS
ncbi:BTB/POZ domain-containing protein 17-like [Saccoglossus kowalevskii]